MNATNAKEYLPLIQALSQGATIQRKNRLFDDKWKDDPDPCFTYPPDHYRIKKTPQNFWINLYPNRRASVHFSLELADQYPADRMECILVREVIDE